MIRNSSYMSALGVSSFLASKGIQLVAKPSTMLSELAGKSIPDSSWLATNVGIGDLYCENYATMLSIVTDDHGNEPNLHTLALGKFIDDINKPVAAHIAFAKNTVKPLVVELAEQLNKTAQELKAVSPASGVEVIVKSIPYLMKDESFLDTLSYYKDRTPSNIRTTLKLGPRTNDEVRALMVTGHQRTDEMVVQFLGDQEANFPMKVWNTYFGTTEEGNVPNDYFYPEYEMDSWTPFDRIAFFLGCYLIARRIYDDVQDSSYELATYRNIVIGKRDYYGASLVLNLKLVYNMVAAKTLVAGFSTQKKCITVNGELYSDWLAAGGKPEILLGMLVANNVTTNQKLIDDKAAEHLSSWNSYLLFSTTKNNNEFFAKFKLAILDLFNKQLLLKTPTEEEVYARSSDRLVELSAKAEAYVDGLKNSELADGYDIALYLVAKLRFNYTSSYQILGDIQEAYKANPNVDIREAALLAAINYLGDWLGDQIMIATK